MKSNKTYGLILNDKFSKLSFPDMNTTWPGMKDILDKEMPQEKKRRRFFWFSKRTSILSLILAISTIAALSLNIRINYAQNNLLMRSIVIQNENESNQFVNSTSKEESLTEKNVRKNEDDILPGQNTGETKNYPPIFPSDYSQPENKQLLPETGITASDFNPGEPETIPKTIFKGTQQSTNKSGFTANADKRPGAKTGKNKSAEQEMRVSTTSLGKIDISPSYDGTGKPGNKQRATNNITPAETVAQQKNKEIELTKEEIQINDAKMKNESSLTSEPGNKQGTTKNITPSKTVALQNAKEIERTKDELQINDAKLKNVSSLKSEPVKDSSVAVQSQPLKKYKGWVAGVSVNYNLPVSQQEMSTVNVNGKKNTLIDFLPSVYVQYHFNKKWYAETEFQFSSPQYTSNHKLASAYKNIDPNKKEENAVWLNKLYYLNIPVSIHFRALPNLTIGTGIQFSHLRRSIFTDEVALWENSPNGWVKTVSQKDVKVKSNNGCSESSTINSSARIEEGKK